jgi:glyoxylase-like metal-dependent hydrolase (beta-lactamase superfamily II)
MVSPSSLLTQISEHVYWMKPSAPDRPSLCAVVGKNRTLMLDGGSSAAHARLFLEAMDSHNLRRPDYVALSHWHWDHVFGLAELGVPVIAHQETARQLGILAGYAWDDAALDARVVSGEEIAFCADNIKLELPSPRHIEIAQPDIILKESLTFDLGDVICHLQHVGGDHAGDSCVMYIPEDRVLFLGDCLYDAIYTPVRHYTRAKLFPLLKTLRAYDADWFIEGHSEAVLNRAEFNALTDKFYRAVELMDQHGPDAAAILQQTTLDEDTDYFVRAFIAGQAFE